jgi:hypothetical protein
MSDNKQEKTATVDGVVPEVKPACTALVPLGAPARRLHGPRRSWLPNPMFVAHLIATAQRVPQTRGLYRASFADAQTAYHANGSAVRDAGTRTRQII